MSRHRHRYAARIVMAGRSARVDVVDIADRLSEGWAMSAVVDAACRIVAALVLSGARSHDSQRVPLRRRCLRRRHGSWLATAPDLQLRLDATPVPSARAADGRRYLCVRQRSRTCRAHQKRCRAARRDYDPTTGTFTTRDPLDGVDGTTTVANPYHYVGNDPLNRVDPLGLRTADANLTAGLAGPLATSDGARILTSQGPMAVARYLSSYSAGLAQSMLRSMSQLMSLSFHDFMCDHLQGTSFDPTKCDPYKHFKERFEDQQKSMSAWQDDLRTLRHPDKLHEVVNDADYQKVLGKVNDIYDKAFGIGVKGMTYKEIVQSGYDHYKQLSENWDNGQRGYIAQNLGEKDLDDLVEWLGTWNAIGWVYIPIYVVLKNVFKWAAEQLTAVGQAIQCSCAPPSVLILRLEKASR